MQTWAFISLDFSACWDRMDKMFCFLLPDPKGKDQDFGWWFLSLRRELMGSCVPVSPHFRQNCSFDQLTHFRKSLWKKLPKLFFGNLFQSLADFFSKKLFLYPPPHPNKSYFFKFSQKWQILLRSYFSNKRTWEPNVGNILNGIYTWRQLFVLQRKKIMLPWRTTSSSLKWLCMHH